MNMWLLTVLTLTAIQFELLTHAASIPAGGTVQTAEKQKTSFLDSQTQQHKTVEIQQKQSPVIPIYVNSLLTESKHAEDGNRTITDSKLPGADSHKTAEINDLAYKHKDETANLNTPTNDITFIHGQIPADSARNHHLIDKHNDKGTKDSGLSKENPDSTNTLFSGEENQVSVNYLLNSTDETVLSSNDTFDYESSVNFDHEDMSSVNHDVNEMGSTYENLDEGSTFSESENTTDIESNNGISILNSTGTEEEYDYILSDVDNDYIYLYENTEGSSSGGSGTFSSGDVFISGSDHSGIESGDGSTEGISLDVSGDTFTSDVSGDTFTSDVSGDTFTSDVSGDTFTSDVSGDTYTSGASGDTYTSGASGDTYTSDVSADTSGFSSGESGSFSGDSSGKFSGDISSGSFETSGGSGYISLKPVMSREEEEEDDSLLNNIRIQIVHKSRSEYVDSLYSQTEKDPTATQTQMFDEVNTNLPTYSDFRTSTAQTTTKKECVNCKGEMEVAAVSENDASGLSIFTHTHVFILFSSFIFVLLHIY